MRDGMAKSQIPCLRSGRPVRQIGIQKSSAARRKVCRQRNRVHQLRISIEELAFRIRIHRDPAVVDRMLWTSPFDDIDFARALLRGANDHEKPRRPLVLSRWASTSRNRFRSSVGPPRLSKLHEAYELDRTRKSFVPDLKSQKAGALKQVNQRFAGCASCPWISRMLRLGLKEQKASL